jgi:hypothetical protein
MSLPEGLARLAADPELDAVWAAARDKWCELGRCAGAIPVQASTADPIRRLLGRSRPQATVPMRQLAAAVHGDDRLRLILEAHGGELIDRRAVREADRRARRAARDGALEAWLDALPANRAERVRALDAERRGGLPELSTAMRVALRRVKDPSGSWSTFDEAGVDPRSAAWRVAGHLLSAAGSELGVGLRLCTHDAEARARTLGLSRGVAAFAAQHGGRAPLAAVPVRQLDAILALCADLERRVADATPVPRVLAVLAAERFGDPHALDRGEPCGGVASRLLEARTGVATRTAEGWALGWAAAGVDVDRVSSRVIVGGLRPHIDQNGPLAERLRRAAEIGDEESLSVRQLGRGAFPTVVAERVLVVENPPVFELLLDDLDADGRTAMVCSMGLPRVACLRLVRALVSQGVEVTASADADGGGRTALAMLAAAGAKSMRPAKPDRFEEQRLDELRAWLRHKDSGSRAMVTGAD